MSETKKNRTAFQALVDTVSFAPLMRIRPEGYAVITAFGRHFTFTAPPRDSEFMTLYSMEDLQTAYAMGRAAKLESNAETLKSERRADVEYRSWFKGGLFRKMRRIRLGRPSELKLVCGYPQCGEDCTRGCDLPEDAKRRLESQ